MTDDTIAAGKNGRKVSQYVIRRLPKYYRFLDEIAAEGEQKISSFEMASRMKLTASQIRQDFNHFGGFGQQGYGYDVIQLRGEIGKIIGVKNQNRAVLIGAGNLGKAVAMHLGYVDSGVQLTGVFDINPDLQNIDLCGIKISLFTNENIAAFCKRERPTIALLCIPKEATQLVASTLISLGIKGFWNFSHYDISANFKDVFVEDVNLTDSLLTLAYNVNHNGDD
ncbi:MAG: redox-sensing transcriptional repressor Rex [Oscillospiraceae bacterium]|jgi:redox-sensing transcriptional repressor|nr:redox-sensing transcriptional repressor Rex [Oscillospiraceae bacterium]